MSNSYFTPETIRQLYGEIIPTYQAAFAVPPWNEVSKCVDGQARCAGRLSSVAIGSLCDTCGLRPVRPAYEADELTKRFDDLGLSRPTAWYTERNNLGLTLAAVAWKALPSDIATEKYADVPEMVDWMVEKLGDEPVMWLDEVFANRQLKSKGNLQNFGVFVGELATRLECNNVAYRTIEPRMTTAPNRDFNDNAIVLARGVEVPDRRDFVIISVQGEAL